MKVTVLHIPPAPHVSSSTATSTTGSFTLSWTAAGLVYDGGTATSTSVEPTATGNYQYAVRACAGSICSAWANVPHMTRVTGGIGSNAQPAAGSSSP